MINVMLKDIWVFLNVLCIMMLIVSKVITIIAFENNAFVNFIDMMIDTISSSKMLTTDMTRAVSFPTFLYWANKKIKKNSIQLNTIQIENSELIMNQLDVIIISTSMMSGKIAKLTLKNRFLVVSFDVLV